MNKLTTLLTTAFFLAVFASPPALAAFGHNDGIPLIMISDATTIKTRYRITGIGSLGFENFATNINDKGVVVGKAFPTGGGSENSRTFVFQNNTFRFLKNFNLTHAGGLDYVKNTINNSGRLVGTTVLNGSETPAVYTLATNRLSILPKRAFGVNEVDYFGINDFGQLFGQLFVFVGDGVGTPAHLFLFDKGRFNDLGVRRNSSNPTPFAINNKAAVVGFSQVMQQDFPSDHAFLYEKGVMKDLVPSELFRYNNFHSFASDINNLGQVVVDLNGYLLDSAVNYSFIYQQGRYTKFQVALKGQPFGFAIVNASINNRSEIVGTYADHAVIYRNGVVADLNTLIPPSSGWVLESASDINNFGQIVGWGKKNGRSKAFLLTPVKATIFRPN